MSDDKSAAADGWDKVPGEAAEAKAATDETKVTASLQKLRAAAAKTKRAVKSATTTSQPASGAPNAALAETAPMPKVVDSPSFAPTPGPVQPVVKPDPVRRTRKARLRLTRIDPWSVMKTALLFAVAFGIMMWMATWIVWGIVQASGLFDSINNIFNQALGSPDGTSNFKLQDYVSTGRVLGYAAIIAVLNIVITTALATLFAFLYNLSATILGGLEVTLAED